MICVQAVFQLRRAVGDLQQLPTILLWPAAVTSLLSIPCDLQFITFIRSQRVFLLSFTWVLHIYRIESHHPEWYLLTTVVLKAAIKETTCVTCVRKLPRCKRCIRRIGSGVSRVAYTLLRRSSLAHAFLPGLWCLCTGMFIIASQDTTCLLYSSLSIFGLML